MQGIWTYRKLLLALILFGFANASLADQCTMDMGGGRTMAIPGCKETPAESTAKPAEAGAPNVDIPAVQAPPNIEGFCDRVQAQKVYQRYAKVVGDSERGQYDFDYSKHEERLTVGQEWNQKSQMRFVTYMGRDPNNQFGKKIPQQSEVEGGLFMDTPDNLLWNWLLKKNSPMYKNEETTSGRLRLDYITSVRLKIKQNHLVTG